jgi:hypothetical protein
VFLNENPTKKSLLKQNLYFKDMKIKLCRRFQDHRTVDFRYALPCRQFFIAHYADIKVCLWPSWRDCNVLE